MEHTVWIDSEAKSIETRIYESTIAYVCINASFDPLHGELSSPQLLPRYPLKAATCDLPSPVCPKPNTGLCPWWELHPGTEWLMTGNSADSPLLWNESS